ncbi:MAG: xyloglucanase [Chloroflexi bacterium]|nr:xyloglucanase [Chloroflexota bacterium]
MRVTSRFVFVGLVVCLLGVFAQAAGAQSIDGGRQRYTWRNVEIVGGGFVTGIVFNPTQRDLVYARTDIGGAYRLDPTTRRWIPLTDWVSSEEWNLLGIESLATDPVDPRRVYLAAGTYTNDWSPMNGAILRSKDQGATWQRTDLPFKLGGNMPGRSMGERLMVDPNNNRVLYLGTRSQGLWRSSDYGATWARVNSFPTTGDYKDSFFNDGIGIVWLVFDPRTGTRGSTTQTIYAGVVDTQTSIYRSTDGGATWAAVPGQPTAGFFPHHGALDADGQLYITYGNTPGPYDITRGAVWKYATATGAWTNISPAGGNSFGYGGLALDAQHPGTLMVASMNQWWPDDNLYRSTDGGATWTALWTWGNYPQRNLRYTHNISASPWLTFGETKAPPEISPKLGWMIGDLEIDPHNADRMMYGTGATIYGSDNLTALDRGGNINLAVKAQGLEETAVLGLISPPTGAHLVSALGDIAGFRHDDLTVAPAWSTNLSFGTVTSIDYAERRPSFMARVGYPGVNTAVKALACSSDGGASWTHAAAEPASGVTAGTVAVAADASAIVWSGTSAGVNVTRDCGTSWTASSGIPASVNVISDRVNPAKFYGFDPATGTLYMSTDGGISFTVRETGLPITTHAQLDAVPQRQGDLWLSLGTAGLYSSTNSGAKWTKVAKVQESYTLGFGKAAPGQKYLAIYLSGKINGVRGVFRSDNAGASWVRINDDQHQYGAINQTITGDPRIYGRVYLGTNGRGILYADPVK